MKKLFIRGDPNATLSSTTPRWHVIVKKLAKISHGKGNS